jgi:hypothetical protein
MAIHRLPRAPRPITYTAGALTLYEIQERHAEEFDVHRRDAALDEDLPPVPVLAVGGE